MLILLFIFTIFLAVMHFGGGVGIYGTFFVTVLFFMVIPIYITLFIIVDAIVNPNISIISFLLTLIFYLIFSLYIIPDLKILSIILGILVVTATIYINKSKKNSKLRYTTISILITAIILFFINSYNNATTSTGNILTGNSGYKGKYCNKYGEQTCEEYSIPAKYKKISPLYISQYDKTNVCPYFAVKNKDGTLGYIDRNNNNILDEFEDAIFVNDIIGYTSSGTPINADSFYFKVKKNGKYGLYEFHKYKCGEHKLVIPIEYEADDIKLYADFPSRIQFIITKKNNLYNLYFRSYRTDNNIYSTKDYKLIYKNINNISIINNERPPYRIMGYSNLDGYYNHEKPYEQDLYDYAKILINDYYIYLHSCSVQRKINPKSDLYYRTDFDCI